MADGRGERGRRKGGGGGFATSRVASKNPFQEMKNYAGELIFARN